MYVTDSLYTSTGWYPVTLTSKDSDIGGSKGSAATKQKGKCKDRMNYSVALYIKAVLKSLPTSQGSTCTGVFSWITLEAYSPPVW